MMRALKFWLVLLLLVVLGVGIYFIVRDRQSAKDLADYRQFQKNLEVFKNDNYGGKTPEETLKLFVDALKEGDVDKASLYFVLDDNGSREKWVATLNAKKQINDLGSVMEIVNKAEPYNKIGDQKVSYRVLNELGITNYVIQLIYNGNVWKIESL